ncbi:MAG: hypothetical protein LBK73_15120 [Treponema sp.]|nr:hypothetical protein [Treponema sp.]
MDAVASNRQAALGFRCHHDAGVFQHDPAQFLALVVAQVALEQFPGVEQAPQADDEDPDVQGGQGRSDVSRGREELAHDAGQAEGESERQEGRGEVGGGDGQDSSADVGGVVASSGVQEFQIDGYGGADEQSGRIDS